MKQINQISVNESTSQLTTLTPQQSAFSIVNIGSNLSQNIKEHGGDFHRFVNILSANFSLDYFQENSLHFEKLKAIYAEVLERNWSREYFMEHIKKFLLKQKFPNFTFADFFDIDIPKLKDYNLYCKLLDESANKEYFNNSVYRYRFINDGKLSMFWIYKQDISEKQNQYLMELSKKHVSEHKASEKEENKFYGNFLKIYEIYHMAKKYYELRKTNSNGSDFASFISKNKKYYDVNYLKENIEKDYQRFLVFETSV